MTMKIQVVISWVGDMNFRNVGILP